MTIFLDDKLRSVTTPTLLAVALIIRIVLDLLPRKWSAFMAFKAVL